MVLIMPATETDVGVHSQTRNVGNALCTSLSLPTHRCSALYMSPDKPRKRGWNCGIRRSTGSPWELAHEEAGTANEDLLNS
ncbi:hypothetical protein PSPTOT1_5471 [Pseudomonas syringae pv. tomato T1]|nr:hypothetical protein PSPTOT1_5471 [Pseudomonas syringae pv. tomato T1]